MAFAEHLHISCNIDVHTATASICDMLDMHGRLAHCLAEVCLQMLSLWIWWCSTLVLEKARHLPNLSDAFGM